MEKMEILKTTRNILLRAFGIGLIFLILAGLLYWPCECFLAKIYAKLFGTTSEMYNAMWVSFIGSIKTIIIFIFLVPALAIHAEIICRTERSKNESEI